MMFITVSLVEIAVLKIILFDEFTFKFAFPATATICPVLSIKVIDSIDISSMNSKNICGNEEKLLESNAFQIL